MDRKVKRNSNGCDGTERTYEKADQNENTATTFTSLEEVALRKSEENYSLLKPDERPIKQDRAVIPDNPQDSLIGLTLQNRYEIIKKVGSAHHYEVFTCLDKQDDKILAVVAFDKEHSDCIDIVMQETERMRRLHHRGIPQIIDVIQTDRYLFVIREYMEGRTLSSLVKQDGAQPLDTVLDWGKEVCSILQYLHSLTPPRIQNNVNPTNLFVTHNGDIKLMECEQIFETYTPLQQRGYAAPEQFGGMRQTDARTDIYGLGAVLYHVITGINLCEPPYEIRPLRTINRAFPKELEKIISKCVEIDPEKRYQSATALLSALDAAKNKKSSKGFLAAFFKKCNPRQKTC